MMGGFAQRVQRRLEEGAEHPSALIRRAARLAHLAMLAVQVMPRSDNQLQSPRTKLVERLASSRRVGDYLVDRTALRRSIGMAVRAFVLRESADARRRFLAKSDRQTFVLRVDGPINQEVLRNLLIWHNHVLTVVPGLNDGQAVDVIFSLTGPVGHEPRTSDLISTALMLQRTRSLIIAWTEDDLQAVMPDYISEANCQIWSVRAPADDLRQLYPGITAHVDRQGTCGGVKLPLEGRKRVQEFFKAAFRARSVIAVALREDEEGAIDPAHLEMWLPLFAAAARNRRIGFVILGRLAPSQWRDWPDYIRFAQHEGFSLQDAICVAQVADGYVVVLDIFGLAANAVGRPGVYVPLINDDAPSPGRDESEHVSPSAQIMVGSCDPARIEASIDRFMATL
jgi:hypothetical protein